MIFFNLRLPAHNLFLDRILIDYKKKNGSKDISPTSIPAKEARSVALESISRFRNCTETGWKIMAEWRARVREVRARARVCVGEARPMCDHGREVSHCNATDRPGTRYQRHVRHFYRGGIEAIFLGAPFPCSAVAWNEQKLAVMRTYRDRLVEETRSLSRLGRKTRINRPIKANLPRRTVCWYCSILMLLQNQRIYIYIQRFLFRIVDSFFLEHGTLSIR